MGGTAVMNKDMDAINLLEEELKKDHSASVPAIPIINYLISQCKESKELSERIFLEDKNIKDCLEYVLQEAKKKLNNKNGWLDDQEVYDMAEEYYISDEIKIEKPEDRIAKLPKTSNNKNKKVVQMANNKAPEKEQLTMFDM